MAQYEMNLRDQWHVVRRRWRPVVGCAVVTAILSGWFAARQPVLHQATTAVQYEPLTMPASLSSVASVSGSGSVETQIALIKSYPVLSEVARRLEKLPSKRDGEAFRDAPVYTAGLDALGRQVKATRSVGTSIIEITAIAPNPSEARELARTVAETYRDYNRAARQGRVSEARKFVESQLKDVEERVRRAAEDDRAYRATNRVIAPGLEAATLSSMFTQTRTELERVRQQRTELEQAQALVGRADGGARVLPEGAGGATLQRLQALEVELRLERNQVGLELTERHPRVQALDDRLREVRAETRRELGAHIERLRWREGVLDRQMESLLRRSDQIEPELHQRQRDAKLDEELLGLLKTKRQEALIKEAEVVEEVAIIRPAQDATPTSSTRLLNTVLLGGLLGLVVGVVLAFVQETLDTSIGTIEDVEGYLQMPVVGIIPHIDAREGTVQLSAFQPALADADPETLENHVFLVTLFERSSPAAEAYRMLRTNVQFIRTERPGKTLLVTSSTLQEGKTTTLVNLAVALAQGGQRVLLVDANLRRPSLHRFFRVTEGHGLLDVLVGNARWRDCVTSGAEALRGHEHLADALALSGLERLDVVLAGGVAANPSELLSTPAMTELLSEAGNDYDIVLIDAPPVLPVTDAAILAAHVDGVVLVYEAGKVGRLVLKRAKAHLEGVRAPLWGVVLNDVRAEVAVYAPHYIYYYGDGAAPLAPSPAARRSLRRAYADVWSGIVVLAALATTLAVILAWRLGWLELVGRATAGS
ncbi:MAG: AAA family ATPase [Candidatus Rokubacteria bacterium]|nr:AAA family ATPase [Candidatus Rokubacteria bacterium]